MRIVINFIAFQAGWFASVLGTAHGRPWLGPSIIPLVLILHLLLTSDWRKELCLALGTAAIGFTFDTVLIWVGIFSPVPFLLPLPYSPPWMVMLWVNFSTTLNGSLRSLRGRYLLAAILGAFGGPAAYYSGAELGAMTAIPETSDLLVLAAAWAGAVPLLFRLSAWIYHPERRAARRRAPGSDQGKWLSLGRKRFKKG